MQMPTETAPLDVAETAVGYELDTITMRDIASVRYVRHHEWLDHLLGSALPTSRILPPKIENRLSLEELEAEADRLDAEIEALEKEQEKGWQFHLNPEKASVLSDLVIKLRTDFGQEAAEESIKEAERVLGKSIIEAPILRPVNITYERKDLPPAPASGPESPEEPAGKEPHPITDSNTAADAKASPASQLSGTPEQHTAPNSQPQSTISVPPPVGEEEMQIDL